MAVFVCNTPLKQAINVSAVNHSLQGVGVLSPGHLQHRGFAGVLLIFFVE
jgi:hypothetical protein